MFVDDLTVMLLCTPIFLPIVAILKVDPLWFAVLFMIMINVAWLTPPYGFNLFIVKGIVPSYITMEDIYKSVIPFIVLQIMCFIVVLLFPQLALFLPSMMTR